MLSHARSTGGLAAAASGAGPRSRPQRRARAPPDPSCMYADARPDVRHVVLRCRAARSAAPLIEPQRTLKSFPLASSLSS